MNTEERKKLLLYTFANYLSQLSFGSAEENIGFLEKNVGESQRFFDLFVEKFNPDGGISGKNVPLLREKSSYLRKALSIKNDKERAFFEMMFHLLDATVRTNYFVHLPQRDFVSIKVKSAQLPNIPKPHLFAEIFVHHKDFQAIHLRGSAVARGGLRWSTRHKDLRTEIFGLVKTQILKNCVIVPGGAKGGFVLNKNNPKEAEVVACYKSFLSAMLDITDNVVDGSLRHPFSVVCYDGWDPYLVVAADKGTASFSDYANSVSGSYKFWLGDAFASGGSNGYSHKGLAITARGAWESVRWHARECGVDIDKDVITAVGIGGMSGDVFGNGVLYNNRIKLLAAVSDEFVFVDPNPDLEKSFKERQRLFKLGSIARWSLYNSKLISEGGGVFPRDTSDVVCSAQMRSMFNLPDGQKKIHIDDLIKKIFTLPVDLFWSGGIGTFVKSSTEPDASVQDKSNDAVRVDGKSVRARFVGEGANLSFTQAGRVEYSKFGGRCFTDSIDNSGGVDCSDHEVNIKILLSEAVSKGVISSEESKKILLAVEHDVVRLVISNSSRQAGVLSMMANMSLDNNVLLCNKVVKFLTGNGALDLSVYPMPSESELAERQKVGLGYFRPEISVLLSHMKLFFKLLLGKQYDLFSGDHFNHYIDAYFPKLLKDKCGALLYSHQLKKELIINSLTNEIFNTFDMSFCIDAVSANSVDSFVMAYGIVSEGVGLSSVLSFMDVVGGVVHIKVRHAIFALLGSVFKGSLQQLVDRGVSAKNFKDLKLKLGSSIKSAPVADVNSLLESTLLHHGGINVSEEVAKIASIHSGATFMSTLGKVVNLPEVIASL